MPGPNSAPNGDAGLVRGHENERFVFCEFCKQVLPARVDDSRHRVLNTGKTQMKRGK